MDMRQLRYFKAVAEELNFTRAAQRLHITQPPLTRQIQALEHSLGVELFVRKSQGVELTEAGKTLLIDARNLAAMVEQSVERTQMVGRGEAGRLDIGFHGTSAFDVLPRILIAYREAHPDVKLVLHPGQTPVQVPALRQGRVAIVFERQVPNEPDIATELVAQERIVVALPANHRLARRTSLSVDDLREESMVLPESPQVASMAVKVFRAHGLIPKEGPRCPDMTSGTLLVACGAGVSLMPASMAVLAMPGVVYRPLKSRVSDTFGVHCFYLRDEPSPLVYGLIAVVRRLRGRARHSA